MVTSESFCRNHTKEDIISGQGVELVLDGDTLKETICSQKQQILSFKSRPQREGMKIFCVELISLEGVSTSLNPFILTDFANSADPDETCPAVSSGLTLLPLIFWPKTLFATMNCPNSDMEETMPETRGWKGLTVASLKWLHNINQHFSTTSILDSCICLQAKATLCVILWSWTPGRWPL